MKQKKNINKTKKLKKRTHVVENAYEIKKII